MTTKEKVRLTLALVGYFDDAIIVRIHARLDCKDRDEEGRHRLWDALFESLEKRCSGFQRRNPVCCEAPILRKCKLNARQIRDGKMTCSSSQYSYLESDSIFNG